MGLVPSAILWLGSWKTLGLDGKHHIPLDLQDRGIGALAGITVVDPLLALCPRCPAELLHVKVPGVDPRAAAGASPGSLAATSLFGEGVRGYQLWEHLAQEGPDSWQVRDVDGDRGLAEVPVHIDVRDQRGDQAVHLGQDSRDDNEATHTEDEEQDGLLLHGEADCSEDGNADGEDSHVAWYAQGPLDDFVVLETRTLCCERY